MPSNSIAGNIPDWLHSAYTAVRANETNKALAPITLDHLIQEKIDSIEGGTTRALISYTGKTTSQSRISKLDALDFIDATIDGVVAAVRKAGNDPTKLRDLGFDVGESI
jgi:hypothetical protein